MIALTSNFRWMARLVTVAAWMVLGAGSLWADNGLSPDKKVGLVSEYSSRILLIDREVAALQENLAWLNIKIGQMHQYKAAVPNRLEESVGYKAERIRVLQSTRKALMAHLETIRSKSSVKAPVQSRAQGNSSFSQEEMTAAGLEWVEGEGGDTLVRVGTPVCFKSGSAKVAETYSPMLKKVASFIQSHRPWVVVDGFADKDPINTEKYPSNFELGAVRAANIVHALVGFGADPDRFKVASTGKYRFPQARPMSGNKDDERYVNITLMPNGG